MALPSFTNVDSDDFSSDKDFILEELEKTLTKGAALTRSGLQVAGIAGTQGLKTGVAALDLSGAVFDATTGTIYDLADVGLSPIYESGRMAGYAVVSTGGVIGSTLMADLAKITDGPAIMLGIDPPLDEEYWRSQITMYEQASIQADKNMREAWNSGSWDELERRWLGRAEDYKSDVDATLTDYKEFSDANREAMQLTAAAYKKASDDLDAGVSVEEAERTFSQGLALAREVSPGLSNSDLFKLALYGAVTVASPFASPLGRKLFQAGSYFSGQLAEMIDGDFELDFDIKMTPNGPVYVHKDVRVTDESPRTGLLGSGSFGNVEREDVQLGVEAKLDVPIMDQETSQSLNKLGSGMIAAPVPILGRGGDLEDHEVIKYMRANKFNMFSEEDIEKAKDLIRTNRLNPVPPNSGSATVTSGRSTTRTGDQTPNGDNGRYRADMVQQTPPY